MLKPNILQGGNAGKRNHNLPRSCMSLGRSLRKHSRLRSGCAHILAYEQWNLVESDTSFYAANAITIASKPAVAEHKAPVEPVLHTGNLRLTSE